MNIMLRIALIVASLLTLVFIARKVRNAKVKLEDSIFWFCFAVLLLVVSVFPETFYFFSGLAGTEAPVHFVFLFFIFVLLILGFNQSMRISQADTRIKELTQQLAVEKFERYTHDRGQREQGQQSEQARQFEQDQQPNQSPQAPNQQFE